jgi:hypothetical protein
MEGTGLDAMAPVLQQRALERSIGPLAGSELALDF